VRDAKENSEKKWLNEILWPRSALFFPGFHTVIIFSGGLFAVTAMRISIIRI